MTRRPRIVILLVSLALLVILAHDSIAAPQRQFLTRPTLALIVAYRSHVSPHLRGVVQCRFTPTCSRYGLESVQKYGALRGGLRTIWRVARCNPLTTRQGTVDLP